MFLLQALQSFLGDIEQWPSTILNHLFIDKPTPDIIKIVSAFFYGNNIPYNIASYFYEICSEYSGDYATNIMHSYYFIWRSARNAKHLAIYYDTGFKLYMCINGVSEPDRTHDTRDSSHYVRDNSNKISGCPSFQIETHTTDCNGIPLVHFIFSFLADHVHSQSH